MSGYKPRLLEHEKVITPEEKKLLVSHLKHCGGRPAAIMKLALKTGLRASEIAGLKIEHCILDTERPMICVWGGKKRRADQCDTVKISKEFAQDLQQWIKQARSVIYVFETRGHKLSRNTVWSDCKKVYHTLGFSSKYAVHALRHRFITDTYVAFTDPMITMNQARHKNLSITTRYIHLATEESEEFRDKLARV